MAKKLSRIFFILMLVVSIFSITNVVAATNLFNLSNISIKEKSDGVKVNDVSIKNGNINNDISFTSKNDSITYEVTIKNVSNNDITLKSISDNNDSEYLKYSYDDVSDEVVKKGEELTFNVGITYDKEVSGSTVISNKKLDLTITYEAPDGTVGQEVLGSTENPNTGDNINIYILIGVVALSGLVLTFVSKKKISKTLMAIAISSMLIPVTVKALGGKYIITFNNNITVREYTVTFNTNGGSTINSVKVAKGSKLTKPTDPTKSNDTFDDWYTSEELNELYDFDSIVTDDITLYAGWGDYTTSTIIYHSGDGKFADGTTVKKMVIKQGNNAKYSHTENVDNTGKKIDNYGYDWNESNIVGTDRGDTSKSHVVTIPGASNLLVELYYNGESVSYDYATLWEGKHSDYTIENNMSTSLGKFGGYYETKYTVNNNLLTQMGSSFISVKGDSVTFDFISDDDYYGDGYGYYAIVRNGKIIGDEPQLPTANDEEKKFFGWGTDESCTVAASIKYGENQELYACYGIIYDGSFGPQPVSPFEEH